MRSRQLQVPGKRRRRRAPRLLWPALGLALVGAAAVLAGWLRDEDEGEDNLLAGERPPAGSHDPDAPDAPDAPDSTTAAPAARRRGAGRKAAGADSDTDFDTDSGTGSDADADPDAHADGEPALAGSSPPLAAVWIAGPEGNLYVRDSGAAGHDERTAAGALPVLFVHGLAGNGGQWALQLDHLGRCRRALALDLRGHGDSDAAEPLGAARVDGPDSPEGNPYGVAALAGDVAAVADAFALRRFVLVGHSLGAAVAIAYAAAHPGRVAGLVLADPNGDQTRIPRSQMAGFLTALRADPLRELETYFRQLVVGGDREVARWVLEDLRLTAEGAVAAAVEGALEFSPLPALARYPGPRLAVISSMNNLPFSLHRLLPELPVELLRGTGHWLMMDRPDLFNRLLDGFLEQVEG